MNDLVAGICDVVYTPNPLYEAAMAASKRKKRKPRRPKTRRSGGY